MRSIKFLIPFFIFLGLVGFLLKGLYMDPRAIPNAIVDKPMPTWTLPELTNSATPVSFSTAQMKGKVWLVNAWATWCVPCKQEHPELVRIHAKYPDLPLIGFVYRDREEAALNWLNKEGNPYSTVVFEGPGSTAGIDMGITGVPETFLIDKEGIVRKHYAGVLTQRVFEEDFLPLIKKLEAQP